MRVYIAAALALSPLARLLARSIAAYGHEPVSRWHDLVATGARDPADAYERRAVLAANACDLALADVVVAYVAEGVPRETYCEAGGALARGVPVVWICGAEGEGRPLSTAHRLSREVRLGEPEATTAAVMAAIEEVSR